MTTLCIVIVLLHVSPLPLSEPISLIKGVPTKHKRQWARTENQRGVLHCCFLSQFLVPLLSSLQHYIVIFFYPFLFHYRLRLCLGPEVQCLGMLLLVWRNPKAVASPVQHFYFIMLSTGYFFYLCLSEKTGVWMCVCTSVCVCVHIMMMPSKKYLYFTICLKSRSHRHYTERKPRLSWLQR